MRSPPAVGPTGASGMTWDEDLECWVVADPWLARQVLYHPGFSSQTFDRSFQLYMSEPARREHRALTDFLRLWFVQADAPLHAALRRPVQRRLSAAYFRSLAPWITEVVDESLDALAAARPADVIPTVAEAVSGRVMARVVGVDEPPEVLHRWARTLSSFIGAMYRTDHARDAHVAMREMVAALTRAVAVADFPRGTDREWARTAATWAMNLFGGLETTSSLLGSVVLTALGRPGVLAGLADPAPGAAEALVESVLERHPPLRHLGRVVARDQEFAGVRLTAGDLVLVSLTGGPFDGDAPPPAGPDAAGCPAGAGDRHLVFGFGPHYCVGAPLARLEAAILLRRLAARFPDATLADAPPVWGPNLSYVGLDHLYVRLDPARRVAAAAPGDC